MKKIIKIFLGILLLLLFLILYMDVDDSKYQNSLENKIKENTDVKVIKYANYYDKYYIVMDNVNLYLFDNQYKELLREDKVTLYENKNNYDIIYKDGKFMYFDDTLEDDKLTYRYYDIHTYELLNEVLVGGTNG